MGDKKVRKQIYLDAKQEKKIKTLSSRKGKSEAEMIREAVETYLVHEAEHTADPIVDLIGMAQSKQGEGSIHHDRDLLEAFNEKKPQ